MVGSAIDEASGKISTRRVGPRTEQVVEWVRSHPGPVAACYEAGPTGFGLARALTAAGIACEVVAPSKLERPSGDKVKTDRRDAERLARLLMSPGIGAIPPDHGNPVAPGPTPMACSRANVFGSRHRCIATRCSSTSPAVPKT
ncbi:hypothetical protein ACLFMI_21900 [Pseudonocardia nantongensis]|uniref:hypothetical protein n=1 Tax=Pseudonocardia nantongensis TaxID=1181885 RepID=UPI003978413C